jgi:hypothetical protein
MFEAQNVAGTALALGWVTPDRLEAMRAAVRDWGERPDAFSAITLCAALGWVGE